MLKDGKSLCVDALELGIIAHFILDKEILKSLTALKINSIKDTFLHGEQLKTLNFTKVMVLLTSIAELSKKDLNSTLLGILSRALLLPIQQSNSQWPTDTLHWFCHVLSHTVFGFVKSRRTEQFANAPRRHDHPTKTNDAFVDWLHRDDKKDAKHTDDLICLFEDIRKTYHRDPWPSWAELVSFDCLLHQDYLRNLSCEHAEPKALQHCADLHISKKPKKQGAKQSIEQQPKKEEKRDISLGQGFEPVDVESFAHFNETAKSTLTWRKIFVTTKGYIGIGPNWLSRDATVMLVAGAPVPYAFTPLRVDLRRREKDVRADIDVNDKEYNSRLQVLRRRKKQSILRPIKGIKRKRDERKLQRLEEEWIQLQNKLEKVSNPRLEIDGWTLQGEVYIENIMNGEAIQDDGWERIVIV